MNEWIDDSGLPKLQSIQLGLNVFVGDDRDDQKTISDEPYNYINLLIMRSDSE